MEVFLICRYNLARSPFLQALLSSHFPKINFRAAGVEAIAGRPYSPIVRKVADSWGIQISDENTMELETIRSELSKSDLIISADSYVANKISELNLDVTSINCEDYLSDPFFIPKDPDGLTLDELTRELAKVGGIALALMRRQLGIKNKFKSMAFIPNGESDFNTALLSASMEAKARGAILVNLDMRAKLPISDYQMLGLEPIAFDPKELLISGFPKVKPGSILVSDHEVIAPEKLLFSPGFLKILDETLQRQNLVAVTAPRYSAMRRIVDSYYLGPLFDEYSVIAT